MVITNQYAITQARANIELEGMRISSYVEKLTVVGNDTNQIIKCILDKYKNKTL